MGTEGEQGMVCVTGGTGYVASWLIKTLLERGYSVNTTVRFDPDKKRDISYLTTLPGASERLKLFNADLDKPETFNAPIEGCVGVFHVAHLIDMNEKEDEETKTKRAIDSTIGVLQACLNSKTVKKIVYTSSAATCMFSGQDLMVIDETLWADAAIIRSLNIPSGSYTIAKTSAERVALEFAATHGLDIATFIPPIIHGPFITPHCPESVSLAMAMFMGNDDQIDFSGNKAFVHVDDVANAHIHLLGSPNAKGRYICSAVDITDYELYKFLSKRYPDYKLPTGDDSLDKVNVSNCMSFSSQKLLDTGFKYKYGLEEMYDEAFHCCKQRGLL